MITIGNTHNGPLGIGHGGTSAGRFAELVDPHAARVRLHRPVPLDRPMWWLAATDKACVFEADARIATVEPLSAPLRTRQFGRASEAEVDRAEAAWLDHRSGVHMAPTCFACGHQRDGDGLGLRPGPIDGSSLFATSWRPRAGRALEPWLIWAALDCPTGFPALAAIGTDEAAVTGELAVEIRRPVPGDGSYQLLSRLTGHDGRKLTTEAALVDESGATLAAATATWISVPLASVRPVPEGVNDSRAA